MTPSLEPLLAPAFQLGHSPTSWAEVLGFGTGALSVWLAARQNVLNWPLGLLNVAVLGLVFLESRLYADAALQVVFVALQGYGWWAWRHGSREHGALSVSTTSRPEWLGLIAAGLLATASLGWLLHRHTDSTVPFWDASTTSLSLLAIYGQSRKRVESWWLWIAVDLVYIPLYAAKQLYLTSLLYVVFLGLCVLGLRAWRRALRAGPRS